MSDKVNLANAVRALSMDAVQAAKCGHPGMPMGMAEIALVLWTKHLKHNPKNPDWFNRDRFVLSNGHGSMLLYSLLHLTGYDLPLEELKNFRKLGSKTPGHPECDVTPGVETTTGPLGQGLANAVGMALAEKILAHKFNKPDHQLVNHHTYVFCGDGDLMEGISHEACSYAGTHKLEKLIVLYDDNDISIDGEVSGWFTDDTAKRFESYGWHVISKVDGHNEAEIDAAIEEAKQSDKPSLICCKTIIGKGSPNKAGTSGVHGAALGEEEVLLTRKNINWNHEPFEIPEEVYEGWNQEDPGKKYESDWHLLVEAYKEKFTEEFETFNRLVKGDLPKELDSVLENLFEDALEEVTRKNKYQFPPCTEKELNSTAELLAKQWLEELPDSMFLRYARGRELLLGKRPYLQTEPSVQLLENLLDPASCWRLAGSPRVMVYGSSMQFSPASQNL